MQLEDYFDFEKFDTKHGTAERIRVKGTRVAIEIIIHDYLDGLTPEQIASSYPTVSLEQVFATLTYYLRSKAEVDAYMERGERIAEAYYQEYQQRGPYFLRDDALGSPPGQTSGPAHE